MGRSKKGNPVRKNGKARGKPTTRNPSAAEQLAEVESEEEGGITGTQKAESTSNHVHIEDDDLDSAVDGELSTSPPSTPSHSDSIQLSTSTSSPTEITTTSRSSVSGYKSIEPSPGSYGSTGPSQDLSATKKRKRSKSYPFTEQQETDLAEWFKDHEILYNRRHPESHNTLKKKEIIMDKAKTFDTPPTYEQMVIWMDNMRTQFGRVTNDSSKSGKGTNENLTPRDIWIKETFDFLRQYIKRQQTRTNAQFPEKVKKRVAEELELSDMEDESTVETSDAQGRVVKKKMNSFSQAVDAIDKLITRADEISVIRQNIGKPLKRTPNEEKVHKYVEYISTELVKIPENVWLQYTMEHMRLVHSYIERGSSAQYTQNMSFTPPTGSNPYPCIQSAGQAYPYQYRSYNFPQQQIAGDIYRPPPPGFTATSEGSASMQPFCEPDMNGSSLN